MSDTAIYAQLVAELGEPNFNPAPDWEVIVAQALTASVAARPKGGVDRA